MKSNTKLVEQFWREYAERDLSPPAIPRIHSDAFGEVYSAAHSHSADIVQLLVDLADAVRGDVAALAYLGAGPVETLLGHTDRELPNQILDEIEAAARPFSARGRAVRP